MMEDNKRTMFNEGLELGNSVVASGVLRQSVAAIDKLYKQNAATSPWPLRCKVYKDQSKYTIIAFVDTDNSIPVREDLVTSQALKDRDFHVFDFLCTKGNPSFSINKAALSLFEVLHKDGYLSSLENEISGSSSLIITGHSLGGSVAALFTLWLLETTEQKKRKEAEEKKKNGIKGKGTPEPPPNKRTLCVTFGSPLIGNDGLRKAIEEQIWNSCFLHVASNEDPIPRLLVTPARVYKPFGTYLFCSSKGLACFEDPDSILDLLVAISSEVVSNKRLDVLSYIKLVENLENRVKYNENSMSVQSTWDLLQAAVVIQLEGIGLKSTQKEVDTIIAKVKQEDYRRRNVPDEAKKLNDIKMNMAQLEWYKKKSKDDGMGYYDCYKGEISTRDVKVKIYLKKLTDYWIETVADAEKKPQKIQAELRTRWLYGGNNYRRMVEPLDIADYYKGNAQNQYRTRGRSKHYELLEKWYNEQEKPENENKRNEACSMTEDSLFWAHVEEAIIAFNSLKNGVVSRDDKERLKKELIDFERYVMGLVEDFAVSTEIFLKQSSFMQWWYKYEAEYEKIIGSFDNSPLAPLMKNGKYEHYA